MGSCVLIHSRLKRVNLTKLWIYEEKLKSRRFFNGYLQTYVERDVRALINLKNLRQFQQFILLLAGRIGQIVNFTSLSNDIGVSTIFHQSDVEKMILEPVRVESVNRADFISRIGEIFLCRRPG